MDDTQQRTIAPAFGMASPVLAVPSTMTARLAPAVAPVPPASRAPELIGADELAAPPVPAPPTAPAAPPAQPVAAAPVPAPDPASPVGGPPGSLGSAATYDFETPDVGRSTLGERIVFVLVFVLPPLGLLLAAVAAVGSARRRGWVIGLLQAAIAVGILMSVVSAIFGYSAYKSYRAQVIHDQTVAASTAFCATLTKDPTMRSLPTFGWPAVAASIPDSLTAMQAYETRWSTLAKVSPAGIQPDVAKVADAAKTIVDSVTASRVIDDAGNVQTMTEVADASGIPSWYAEYCR